MRLRRESHEDVQEGTLEYKVAVKSVIRYQIQSLLQKLALETGEESIVISTNVNAGTYNHLGSYMGQEYINDSDEFIQTICSRFTDFCASMQGNSDVIHFHDNSVHVVRPEISTNNVRTTLRAPRKTPRKRPFTSPNNFSPPSKRPTPQPYILECVSLQTPTNDLKNEGIGLQRNTEISSQARGENSTQARGENNFSLLKGDNNSSLSKGDNYSQSKGDNNSSQSKGDNSSQFKGDNNNSSETSKENTCYVMNHPWIKSEPVDDYSPVGLNGNSDHESVDDTHSMSIINRPRSLIPLANIFRKYGTKPPKTEPSVTPESLPGASESLPGVSESLPGAEERDEDFPSEQSILRSLYTQPIYHTEEYGGGNNNGDTSSHTPINLPQNLSDSLENFPSITENLVLSGYYDSDNYPAYRHSRKHPSSSGVKKSKLKEKPSSSNASSPIPGSVSHTDTITTVPSSGDLKMKMFESGGRLVYACDVCKRELSHLTSYRRHMKLHTMDRPHKCPVCMKGFIRKYHCIDHLNKHHKGVDFDPDTLTLRGTCKSLEESSALSESISISPSEYNYTLDQSIDDTDESMNANCSIDQSASSMLSELAKSAQKDHLNDLAETEAHNQSHCELPTIGQSAVSVDLSTETEEFNMSLENGSDIKEGIVDKSSPGKTENSAMARKNEVNQCIKAIVADLKSSSKKKKMSIENELPADKA